MTQTTVILFGFDNYRGRGGGLWWRHLLEGVLFKLSTEGLKSVASQWYLERVCGRNRTVKDPERRENLA